MNSQAKDWVASLGLEAHPEGGYYKEVFRSREQVGPEDENRNLATSIYFLLHDEEKSHFHQLRSDELWYFHAGTTCVIHLINTKGDYFMKKLGLDASGGEKPQILIPAGAIFAAEVARRDSFTLMGCMVTPGFDFRDFKLFERSDLIDRYPQHDGLIEKFTR